MAEPLPQEDLVGDAVDMANAVPKWKEYLQRRSEGRQNFELARKLLTQPYREETLPAWRKNTDGSATEIARYEAEQEFFDCNDNDSRDRVQEMLKRIVHQRYRPCAEDSTPISLKNSPARRVIAAERQIQRRLMGLSQIKEWDWYVPIGLEIAAESSDVEETSWFNRDKGPEEAYEVYIKAADEADAEQDVDEEAILFCLRYLFQGVNEVVCNIVCLHRSEPKQKYRDRMDKSLTDVSSYRAGNKYVMEVPSYAGDGGIVAQLQDVLTNTLGGSREGLVEILRQVCRNHVVSDPNIWNMENSQSQQQFLRNCFHILINEQSQFHSACFQERNDWRCGMTVSFARLVKLFKDGYVTLDDMFKKYPLYSCVNMATNNANIRTTCDTIDELYVEKYDVNINEMDKARALKDLEFLYGPDF